MKFCINSIKSQLSKLLDYDIDRNKVCIYPYGELGKKTEDVLFRTYKITPKLIFDNYQYTNNTKLQPISFLSTLNSNEIDLILICSISYRDELLNTIPLIFRKKIRFIEKTTEINSLFLKEKCQNSYKSVCQKAYDYLHYNKDKSYEIPFLVLVTGQKCSLRCKNCCNFSPYHSPSISLYNIEYIISDLKKIIHKVKCIKKLAIQGGECFLHPQLLNLIKFVNSEEKINCCVIHTNAVCKINPRIIDIISSNTKFVIRISPYGDVNKKYVNKLESILKNNNINYYYHNFASYAGEWSYCGGQEISKQNKENTVNNYMKCEFKGCLTLENGIISRCSRATIAHIYQKFHPQKKDFINVRKKFHIIKLKSYIKNANSEKGIVTACFYCQGTSGPKITAGEQI